MENDRSCSSSEGTSPRREELFDILKGANGSADPLFEFPTQEGRKRGRKVSFAFTYVYMYAYGGCICCQPCGLGGSGKLAGYWAC